MIQSESGFISLRGLGFITAAMVLGGISTLSCTTGNSQNSEINTLTPEEEGNGWILLFDGETLEGWRGHGREQVPESHWQVRNGELIKLATEDVERQEDGQPVRGGDLLYEKPFRNFELSFEWKMTPGGNSGIKYNVSKDRASADREEPSYAALGFEYQVLDDEDYQEYDPNIFTAGLYDLIPRSKRGELKPVGEWNSGRIIFDGNHGEHWLNGERVVEYELETSMMDRLLQTSKWKNLPDFGTRREEGHIVIQDHGDQVSYRNIKLREW